MTAIVHEAALRIRVGDRKVLRDQLDFLLEAAEHPGVEVRVLTFEANGFAGLGYSMLYADGPVPELDTAQLDTAHGSVFIDAAAQLDAYRGLFAKAELLSLRPGQSRDVICRLAGEL